MPRRSTNPYKRSGSPFWQIWWRDGSGCEQRKTTRTTNLRVAQAELLRMQNKAAAARVGIVDRYAESRQRPVDSFVVEYRDHLRAHDRAPQYVAESVRNLRDAIAAAKACTLADLSPATVSRHLDELRAEFSAKTLANRVMLLRAFGAWLLQRQAWPENPFAALRSAGRTRDGDRRFRRLALSYDEVRRLAEATIERPRAEYAKSHGGRPNPNAERDDELARERWLIYWLVATTGLRNSEVAALRWEDLSLDGADPFLELSGKFTKNRTDARLPLQRFVAEALGDLRARRGARRGAPVQQSEHVLNVPWRIAGHIRRDAVHAGLIPAHRPADRRLDLHALRHSCVRILREQNVPVEVAQRVLRHSDIRLTLQVYGRVGDETVTAAMRDRVPAPPAVCSQVCSSSGPNGPRRDTTRDNPADGGNAADGATVAS